MTSPARIVALATIFVALASMSCSTSIRLLPPAGVTELRARAELGIAGAQFNLGVMYANGRGVLQDDFEAVHWYRRAADQGLAQAQGTLGVKYGLGEGVPEDDAEAARWFQLAAVQGNARGQFNLGASYANGEGVPQHDVTAHMWLALAASRSTDELRDQAVQGRDLVAKRLNASQLAEAQRLAREWDAAHPRE